MILIEMTMSRLDRVTSSYKEQAHWNYLQMKLTWNNKFIVRICMVLRILSDFFHKMKLEL